MNKYVCSVCGYVYDEAKGDPANGIAPGTAFDALPNGWVCPLCGAAKGMFDRQAGAEKPVAAAAPIEIENSDDLKKLTALETSELCSNLARGCEKQYQAKEAALFTELSAYFKSVASPAESPSTAKLLELLEHDLQAGFVAANAAAADPKDRGAMRALVWSEKVSKIINSLLQRYNDEGEAMLQNTNVYVCTICGFIYMGATPPELCPVCKVPSWKFEKIEGRA